MTHAVDVRRRERVAVLKEPCAECCAVSAAVGGVEFMDPPDGGDVSLAEQVRRMREEITTLRTERDEAAYRAREYWKPILKERDDWILDLLRERDAAHAALNAYREGKR